LMLLLKVDTRMCSVLYVLPVIIVEEEDWLKVLHHKGFVSSTMLPLVLCMLLSSRLAAVATFSRSPRSVPTSFLSSRMHVTPSSIVSSSPWSTASLLMLHSPISLVSSPSTLLTSLRTVATASFPSRPAASILLLLQRLCSPLRLRSSRRVASNCSNRLLLSPTSVTTLFWLLHTECPRRRRPQSLASDHNSVLHSLFLSHIFFLFHILFSHTLCCDVKVPHQFFHLVSRANKAVY